MTESYLDRLNQKQKEAVISKSKYLQILAGPGSGKTRVLTTRVAHLVLHEKVNPTKIIVATFTRKAAFEMKDRLESGDLLGPIKSNQLTMGTFHSICARYLRQYATSARLPNDFRIIEPDETKKTLYDLLSDNELAQQLTNMTERTKTTAVAFGMRISEAKNNGLNAEDFEKIHHLDFTKFDLITIFKAYDERLRVEHLVDFDDLLLFGRQLFKSFPHIMDDVSHILVDEFQDTNLVQYDIIRYIARNTKHVTIVGDPDQSIYGFRNANVGNFNKMIQDFDKVDMVMLEENYRSTDCILNSAYHVIQQDGERIEKGLFTNNGQGTPISLLHCQSEIPESMAVAEEILRVTSFSKGLIQYKDIAILVRTHYLTQNVESILKASGIPYDIVGGVRFFERKEIKDLVAYVHFIHNPNDTLSFERIINTPRRGVGQVTLDKICTLSRVRDKTVLDIIKDLCSPTRKRKSTTSHLWDFALPAKVKTNLKKFIKLCDDVKIMMDEKESVRRILDYIIKFSDYHEFLKQENKDHEVRWDNVGELMTIAGRYDKKADGDDTDGDGSQLWGDQASQTQDDGSRRLIGDIDEFVTNTTLDPTGKDDQPSELQNRVQIMTIHAAKGLEWPCVFILACEQGIIPHQRAENPNEEARLLYVAMTRAKCFLYISYASYRSSWAKKVKTHLSSFLQDMPPTAFQRHTPAWNNATRSWTSHVLRLPSPSPGTAGVIDTGDDNDSDATKDEQDNIDNSIDMDGKFDDGKSDRTVGDCQNMGDDNDSDATTDEEDSIGKSTDMDGHGNQALTKLTRLVNPDDHPGDEFPDLDFVLEDGSREKNRAFSYMYDYDSDFGVSDEEVHDPVMDLAKT